MKKVFAMRKTYKYILIMIFVIIVSFFAFLLFDNTSDKVVDESKINVIVLIDKSSIYNKSTYIKAKLIVKNQNGFDINMFNVSYQDNDLSFDLNCDGVYRIKSREILERDFVMKLNNSLNEKDILSLIRTKNISVGFNADSANQNNIITRIKPEIEIYDIN